MVHAVALVGIEELDRLLRLGSIHDDVRHPIDIGASRRNVAAEVGMEMPRSSVVDERDERRGIGVHGPGGDVEVPPVRRWKKWKWTGERAVGHRADVICRRLGGPRRKQASLLEQLEAGMGLAGPVV